MPGPDLRIRLRSARHPYGHRVWGFEVYDPARRPGMQVLATVGWYASWDAARRRGLAARAEILERWDPIRRAGPRLRVDRAAR